MAQSIHGYLLVVEYFRPGSVGSIIKMCTKAMVLTEYAGKTH